MRTFVIDIPDRTPTLNEWQRMHWSKRSRAGKVIASHIWSACRPPRTPLSRCRITVERTSTQAPDIDNLYGGLKPLLDALQPVSKRHPHGLGFIANDSPVCIAEMAVRHVPGRARRTVVTIEELEPANG